jgi:hypothetical protein
MNTEKWNLKSRFRVSGFSPAVGLKNGQFDRSGNFGNVVSYEVVTKK